MSQAKETPLMEKIVSLCKRRGFIFQSSEIYGGINGFWDYGPLGAELKRNLRDTWWRAMTREREDVVGLDATIIMHPAIWKASGHVDTFADLMRECPLTRKRVRADHVEPASGVIFSYSGAIAGGDLDIVGQVVKSGLSTSDDSTAEELGGTTFDLLKKGTLNEAIRVLVPKGKPAESARKIAVAFYQSRGIQNPELLGENHEAVENSIDFHPESFVELTAARPFNLMFKTHYGPIESDENLAYLRPETAQAIFAQFKNVVDSTRQKVPFGICQIGKAFRNEVTPRNFTFRSREFEQMELEFFIKPDEAIEAACGNVAAWSESADLSKPEDNWGWEMWHRYWVKERTDYYASIGLGADVLAYHWQTKEELAHYARACVDILFKFPFGTEELEGIAARGDFDLSQHQRHSKKPQEVFDEDAKKAFAAWTEEQKSALVARKKAENAAKGDKALPEADIEAWCEKLFKGFYVPHVIEPSAGLDRLALAIISKAFTETEKTDTKGVKEVVTVMRFHPRIAPVKVGIFPLLKNKPELVAKAREVYELLKPHMTVFYDEGGSIGKRYARQDEAGTPFGVTIDFDTLGENGPELKDTVTLRHRDDARQERVKISDLPGLLLPQVR